jgi:hypothetical protein
LTWTNWLQPTAQYGQTLVTATASRIREAFSIDLGLIGWRATDRSFEDLAGAIELFAPFFDFDEFFILLICLWIRYVRALSPGKMHSTGIIQLQITT